MHRHLASRSRLAVLLGGLLLLAACSGDPAVSGASVIEGEIAGQIGLGDLEASCDEPTSEEVGSTFACTATTPDGRVIDFISEFDTEDEIFVYPTNVLADVELPLVEAEAAEVLSPEVGTTIDPSSIDCGEETVILDSEGVMTCVLTDESNGDRYELEATFTNHDREEGFFNRDYLVVGLLQE
ncbi:MAG: hypothetical protein AAGA99_22250 [Actinomycetota bacterium]